MNLCTDFDIHLVLWKIKEEVKKQNQLKNPQKRRPQVCVFSSSMYAHKSETPKFHLRDLLPVTKASPITPLDSSLQQ